ncbi:glycosylhydrolase 11-2 [Penicillium riverlandense]|uniref:glycosylhydrolase 11-2 n=1 Tax=Penicillium riverlandense TaxID=1903569 RepID=UPI0025466C4B|nr:glycosylhydrolase 11-2 [Penicillium riverlandense]KAJ5831867.1 glycosylhydrolase 11-2 [Penicillium riverlandense]
MDLGSLRYQVIAVEGWGGSGSASQSISNSGSTSSDGSTGSGSRGGTGSANCSALYGQCGGTGWAGAACCVLLVRHLQGLIPTFRSVVSGGSSLPADKSRRA